MKNPDSDAFAKSSLFKPTFFMNAAFRSLGVNFKYYVRLFVLTRLLFLHDGMICPKESPKS